ncbi:hypothetical protein ABZP36_009960 [Zizania latifolia]
MRGRSQYSNFMCQGARTAMAARPGGGSLCSGRRCSPAERSTRRTAEDGTAVVARPPGTGQPSKICLPNAGVGSPYASAFLGVLAVPPRLAAGLQGNFSSFFRDGANLVSDDAD